MAINVGMRADLNSLTGLIPSGPNFNRRMENPAGFGALAMTVNPPPDTAYNFGIEVHRLMISIRWLPAGSSLGKRWVIIANSPGNL